MIFLRATRTPETATWWVSAAAPAARPVIVTELLRDDSVVCDTPEAEAAIAWARGLPGWSDDAPALATFDSIAERLARGFDDVPPGISPS